MFPLFSFIVLFLSYVTAVCFLSRFPTLFCQISLTLTLFFPNSFAFLSLFLFLMSLLTYCLSFVHCISSILSDFVCFICRSFSFLRHCYIFVFRCLPFPLLRHCCLIAFRSSTVFRQFSMTLFALPLVPFSLRQFFNFFAFLNRSFSYLRHCCIFVFRWRSFSFLRRCYLIIFLRPLYFVNSL